VKDVVIKNFEPVYRYYMTPVVAAAIAGKPVVGLKIPQILPAGAHIYLVETSFPNDRFLSPERADFCAVLGRDGDKLLLDRRVGWSKGAPRDFDNLGMKILTTEYPVLTEAAL
jgi:hypothetical protein